MGDGIKFVEDSVAANHCASDGSASNAIKILVIDVDSSDLRYWLFSCLPLPSYCHSFTKNLFSLDSDVKRMVVPTALGYLAHQKTLLKILFFRKQKSYFQKAVFLSSI